MCGGELSIASSQLECVEPDPSAMMCSLPASSAEEGAHFLEVIGSGGALGTGGRLWQTGVQLPVIRAEYERRIAELVREVDLRRSAGETPEEIARWVVRERTRIANQMRWRSGVGTRVLFEVRDWAEYGTGGRTLRNVDRRYARRGFTGSARHEQMIRGATHPNTGISTTAIRGARYLRHGGRILVVFSVVTTAAVLLTTPEDELARVLHEEAGGVIGGSAGAGLAAGACLVFGIATAGWGLLACGIVGGAVGGAVGSYAGNRLYYSSSPAIERRAREQGIVDANQLSDAMPQQMCVAR